jgi:hypothetical protein
MRLRFAITKSKILCVRKAGLNKSCTVDNTSVLKLRLLGWPSRALAGPEGAQHLLLLSEAEQLSLGSASAAKLLRSKSQLAWSTGP